MSVPARKPSTKIIKTITKINPNEKNNYLHSGGGTDPASYADVRAEQDRYRQSAGRRDRRANPICVSGGEGHHIPGRLHA